MPKRCIDCPFMVSRDNDDCILQTEVENELARTWEELKASCPLTELPPHGRLADLDKIIEDYWDGNHMEIDENDLKAISKYKVIIESERGKANDTH